MSAVADPTTSIARFKARLTNDASSGAATPVSAPGPDGLADPTLLRLSGPPENESMDVRDPGCSMPPRLSTCEPVGTAWLAARPQARETGSPALPAIHVSCPTLQRRTNNPAFG